MIRQESTNAQDPPGYFHATVNGVRTLLPLPTRVEWERSRSHGGKVKAVKMIRERTNCSLAECLAIVEQAPRGWDCAEIISVDHLGFWRDSFQKLCRDLASNLDLSADQVIVRAREVSDAMLAEVQELESRLEGLAALKNLGK